MESHAEKRRRDGPWQEKKGMKRGGAQYQEKKQEGRRRKRGSQKEQCLRGTEMELVFPTLVLLDTVFLSV